MTYIPRCFSTTSRLFRTASAQEACTEILTRFGDKPISVRRQLFDANQLLLLNATLNRSSKSIDPPTDGTPIPPGYHLVYFTPSMVEPDLGLDGTDRTVNPLRPFTRRMWAGGELQWTQGPSLLRVGQTVQETTHMLSAEPKRLKSGDEMIVVGVEKTFENDNGVALLDRRKWVFQQEVELGGGKAPPPKPEEKELPEGEHMRDFLQTPVSLFRFSALTFNGHKIHYSPDWCRAVEGHRDAVVHGPLNLINILDFWRDTARKGDAEAFPRSINYRARSPLYVGEKYRILLGKSQSEWKAEIWDSFGQIAMTASIQE
jgi:hydroxyacyl-ACP dehydratase HTD2-like protein with hotdog domain